MQAIYRPIEPLPHDGQRHYRTLMRSIPGSAVFLFDQHLRCVIAEGPALPAVGRISIDYCGKRLCDILAPHTWAVLEPLCRAALAGVSNSIEVPSDDQLFLHHLLPIIDEGGAITSGMILAQDITERRRSEDQIQLYAEVAHTMQIGLQVWHLNDPHDPRSLRAVTANPAALHFTGVDLTAHYDAPFTTLFPSAQAGALCETYAEVARSGAACDVGVLHLSEPMPARTWMLNAFPLPNRCVGVLMEDISERKEAEDALQKALGLQAALLAEVQEGHRRQQALTHQLITMQERECRRIARELHDEIGQMFTVVKMNLQSLGRALSTHTCAPRITESVASVEHALQQVRNLALDLRPTLLDDLGLREALRWYTDRQAQCAGLKVHLVVDPLITRIDPDLEVTCFRLVQEAVTNIVRHAHASHFWVLLQQQGQELYLIISDDGQGFDVEAAHARAASGASMGLLSMSERVTLANGQLTVESQPGQGCEITARFPLYATTTLINGKRAV